MDKSRILSEIKRTAAANEGAPLGEARFEAETGINRTDWYGKHWAKRSDAVREAGFVPNKLNSSFDEKLLLRKYVEYAQELGKLPSSGDLRLKRRTDRGFPNWNTFDRFGGKVELVKRVKSFCLSTNEFPDVSKMCESYLAPSSSQSEETTSNGVAVGYVYLIKHGSRREYKIGRTNNQLRRHGELAIELPEKIQPVHVIATDDPPGIEAYWHRRFADKNLKNEWFALSADDVRAFKRWRRIN